MRTSSRILNLRVSHCNASLGHWAKLSACVPKAGKKEDTHFTTNTYRLGLSNRHTSLLLLLLLIGWE